METDSRRQSDLEKGESSDRGTSEEREHPITDIAEEREERAGLLSGVLTDEESLNSTPNQARRIFLIRVCLITILASMIIGNILITIFPPKKASPSALYSNGTHKFHNTVLIVSFDGLKSDYLDRNFTPTINAFIHKGLKAEHLIPSFPSMTFPNHYTIITGLYPESHGIVANQFYDPVLNDTFVYGNSNNTDHDSKWWLGEPVWVTAAKQKQKSGVSMWLGTEGYLPTYSHAFNDSTSLDERLDQLIGWLDMELEDRPTFLAGYVNIVDSMGHKFGPDSQEVNDALKDVDGYVKNLLNKIEERNLTDIVNIIFVSDHGMASLNTSDIVYLDDIFDISKVHTAELFPLAGIRPYNDSDIEGIFGLLQDASKNQDWKCYLKENIPERFHYRNSVRIDPILCIPPVGGGFLTHKSNITIPKGAHGAHGYDNEDPSMRGIFLADGPYFKDKGEMAEGNGRVIKPFFNVEVYNIMCNILGLKPAPNNGTDSAII